MYKLSSNTYIARALIRRECSQAACVAQVYFTRSFRDPALRRRAFTLVEVLVTVSIISVLIALVTSGIRGIFAAGKSSMCSNNLRSMGVAAHLYATNNRAAFPAAVIYFQEASSIRTVAWDFESTEGGASQPGALTAYTDHPLNAMQCPEFQTAASTSQPLTGYNYNTTFIGHEGFYPEVGEDATIQDGWSRVRMGVNASQQRHGANVAMFADAGYRGGSNKFMRAPGNTVELNTGMIHAGTNAFCHAGCCNACFLDGHSAAFSTPYKSEFSNAQLLKFVTDFPKNGFLSGDDYAYDPR